MVFYLDTSALVKALHQEAESVAFAQWMAANAQHCYTSDLTRVELLRVAGRLGAATRVQARAVLDALNLVAISPAICDTAGLLEPATLRSLDAIHLATALQLGDDLEALVTYDLRLGQAAQMLAIPLLSPGCPG
ncbi:type II toxin-antitoxin system VapC family toxin [Mobiluncus mulieris]|uniref:Ribonuclease VapC n=1 Tax=Mobiluncus mulieris TaxID=2052 RepID=A0A7Y0UVH3_9ACTO|nr:type II toxin-antitoxin system VapC family toxin [Mobiluncus mulieris]NMX04505.1 type II toxin-antitoxin system VapC family toxin [Mobiluncus mulieris]NMX12633.1 type II toxin-antitoxin system VapC family toxin [Mobiluncus mulieris]